MKRLRKVLTVLPLCGMLLLCPSHTRAEDSETTPLTVGDCSDRVLRVETRLSDLGYLQFSADGVWSEADEAAFSAFCTNCEKTDADARNELFLPRAPRAVSGATQAAPIPVALYGSAMPWADALPLLMLGESYQITNAVSGVSIRMTLTALTGHATFAPVLDWDDATLRGMFSLPNSLEKIPVIILVGNMRVAASISANGVIGNDGKYEYSLYLIGSVSDVGSLTDPEHEETARRAAAE